MYKTLFVLSKSQNFYMCTCWKLTNSTLDLQKEILIKLIKMSV